MPPLLCSPQVLPSLAHNMQQPLGKVLHICLQVRQLEGLPDLLICVLVEGVQVHPQGSSKEHRILPGTASCSATPRPFSRGGGCRPPSLATSWPPCCLQLGRGGGDGTLTGSWSLCGTQGCTMGDASPREQSPGRLCSSRTWKGEDQQTWGMMVRFWRRSWRPIVAISTSSIMIVPPAASSTRKRQLVREDFPAPVRPTTPTCRSSYLDQLTRQMLSVFVWWVFLPCICNRRVPDCLLRSMPCSSRPQDPPPVSLRSPQTEARRTETTLTQCRSGKSVVRADAETSSPSRCSQYCR